MIADYLSYGDCHHTRPALNNERSSASGPYHVCTVTANFLAGDAGQQGASPSSFWGDGSMATARNQREDLLQLDSAQSLRESLEQTIKLMEDVESLVSSSTEELYMDFIRAWAALDEALEEEATDAELESPSGGSRS
jgi:hypothetical protein